MNLLKDLSQIDIKDLKNINLNQLRDNIQKRPEVLINILLIVAALFVIIYMFTAQQNKLKRLKNAVALMKEKLEVVKSLETAQQANGEFIKAFPQTIPSDRLVDKISDFAEAHNVQVVSFLPAKQKSNDILEYTTVTLTVSSSEYQDIVLFIKDIEESPYAWKVERWKGGLQQRTSGKRRDLQAVETSENIIMAQIDIGSIKIKP